MARVMLAFISVYLLIILIAAGIITTPDECITGSLHVEASTRVSCLLHPGNKDLFLLLYVGCQTQD